MKTSICVILSYLLWSVPLVAQGELAVRIPGQLLVFFEDSATSWQHASRSVGAPLLTHVAALGIRNNIHRYRFDEAGVDADALLAWVRAQPEVVAAQWDAEVTFRNTPNDTYYPQQTNLDRIGLPAAWATSTGGHTPGGKPIVVAVMDRGFYPQHEDLRNTVWVNAGEIPGDGIDNDNNGYIDDINGWDYFSNSPAIAPGDHGLSVCGIIGAQGNNDIGVAGINWDVKIMRFSFQNVSDLIKAYEYAIDQRQRFNESGGAEGAFVVATNNSFGQARVRCSQQAVWGAMYDKMGEVGILSSAGVSNERYDVDVSGDMPADCPSDFLLISTNTDTDDNLFINSAFGANTVDIGAPGEGSFTTKPADSYGFFARNSAATPHVTGAIALLYSAICSELEAQAITQPARTALFIKAQILKGVEPLPSLANRTVTGGRLHIGNSMERVKAACSEVLGPLSIVRVAPNPATTDVEISYQVPEMGDYDAILYNALGQVVQRQRIAVAEVGLRSFILPTASLAPGLYFVGLGRGRTWVTAKVVVVR